jgi:hypothetical protein
MPRGRRPSMAARTRSGARNASEIVMLTLRMPGVDEAPPRPRIYGRCRRRSAEDQGRRLRERLGQPVPQADVKFAELVLGPGSVASEVEQLGTGKVDVYGANTNNLLLVAERLPGATFVPGAFFTVHFAVAMPKARSPAAKERLAAIVNDATTTGLLQNAIQKAGLKGVRAPAN